jgi:hypothetical protein
MANTDKRIDEYINSAAPFAQPILKHIRGLVHKACPEVTENVKWRFPVFEYKGILCNMAAFKQYCSFGFWKGALMKEGASFDKITSLKDLPADKKLIGYIKEAVRLNEENIKLPAKPKSAIKKELPVPAVLAAALKKNKKAAATFDNFSPSHRKEYIEWINEAKTEETRDRRVATTIEWLTEGKGRHWKYQTK